MSDRFESLTDIGWMGPYVVRNALIQAKLDSDRLLLGTDQGRK